jgi:hypothetical protein
MPRKRYKSDKTTTVLRVTKTRAKEIRTAARREQKTVFVVTDNALAVGLAPKQI